MDYFCRPRYLDGRDPHLRCRPRRRGHSRGQVGVDGGGDRERVGEGAELSSHRLRDRTHGADPIPRAERTRPDRWSVSKAVRPIRRSSRSRPTDRPQRRARSGAVGPHRLLQARSREVSVGPRRPLAHHRAQETGRPTCNPGKSDPRFGGRVRDPATTRAHRRVHRSGSQSQRRGGWAIESPCRASLRREPP